jgi:rhamnulokinase
MYNPRTGAWATDVLERLGIPTHLLGEIVDPGTVLGPLSESVREDIGAPPFQVVAPGCHDTACAVAAVPAEGDRHVYLSSGTWSLMGIESPEPITSDAALAHGFTNESGVFGSVRVLKNICGLWLLEECRRIWAEQGEDMDYERLVQLAEEAEPFQAAIDPDYAGFATPGDMPGRIRAFCEKTGQTAPVSKGAMVRTILESLALRYRSVLDTLEDLKGQRLEALHIVGGGSKNRLLNQFAANALNRRVYTGPVEATAAGNIIMQLIATGSVKDLDEGRAIVRASFDTETYEPTDIAAWEEAYAGFAKLDLDTWGVET